MQIRKGIRFDDDDQVHNNQPITLDNTDANRNRSNLQKGIDDLLFNGGGPRRRKDPQQDKQKQQKQRFQKQQKKKKLEQQQRRKKQQQKRQRQQRQRRQRQQRQRRQRQQRQRRQRQQRQRKQRQQKDKRDRQRRQKQQKQRRQRQQKDKRDRQRRQRQQRQRRQRQQKDKRDRQRRQKEQKQRRQRQQKQRKQRQQRQKRQSQQRQRKQRQQRQRKFGQRNPIKPYQTFIHSNQRNLAKFNKPSYIRKLKKIAQNFDYHEKNQVLHKYYDVIRMKQTKKSIVQQTFNNQNNYKNGLFNDPQFPARSSSIGGQYTDSKNIQWKRAQQFTNKPNFGKYVQPNDINMGKLSNPIFASVLACLAQREKNIKRLIENQTLNSDGGYTIRINVNGVWRYVVVDDLLPTLDGQNLGITSYRDNQSQISLSLIEKAYAKVFYNYGIFQKTSCPQNYLKDLTGSRVIKNSLNDPNLFDNVKFALQQNWTVIAVPNKKIQQTGFSSSYCYGITSSNARGFEFRNNWGSIVQRPKINTTSQGIFQLSLQQCKKYFSYIMIAQTNDENNTNTIQSSHKNGFYSSHSFRIETLSQQQINISISQFDNRYNPKSTNYKALRIVLQRQINQKDVQFITAGYSVNSRDLDLLAILKSGTYNVYTILTDFNTSSEIFNYNLTISGVGQCIKFVRNNTQKNPNLIMKSLQQQNLQNGKRAAKGHVDQYLLYHQKSNLVLVTDLNVSEKSYDYVQDQTRISFDTLNLLNAPNDQTNFVGRTSQQQTLMKKQINSDRRWNITIQPKQSYTWIVSSTEDYNINTFKGWGYK